jgi:hypothetical protein
VVIDRYGRRFELARENWTCQTMSMELSSTSRAMRISLLQLTMICGLAVMMSARVHAADDAAAAAARASLERIQTLRKERPAMGCSFITRR